MKYQVKITTCNTESERCTTLGPWWGDCTSCLRRQQQVTFYSSLALSGGMHMAE